MTENAQAITGHTHKIVARLQEEGRAHWHEFSVIVASANILLSLLLSGQVVVVEADAGVRLVAGGTAVASVLAAILAYYSIHIGGLLIFGPVRLTQVLASFAVTAAQLSLFLWPTHALTASASPDDPLNALRHWLGIYAAFCLAAAGANMIEHLGRRRSGLAARFPFFQDGQRGDLIAATATGGIALCLWGLSSLSAAPFLIAGITVGIVASGIGLRSQARVATQLYGAMPPQ